MTYFNRDDLFNADRRRTDPEIAARAGRIRAHALALRPDRLGCPPCAIRQRARRRRFTDPEQTETDAVALVRGMLQARLERSRG